MQYLLQSFFCCLLTISATGQITINGVVTDAVSGETVIGATVQVPGTGIGTATDYDGSFRLEVPDTTTAFVVDYLGYASYRQPLDGRASYAIVISEATSTLNEVIVVGYGAQKRSNISGAVSTVTSEEIQEANITRVEQALQGRTAGVQVAQVSGSPGSPLTVRVRGTGSVNNSDPLYLVDGVPVDGIDFLNPDDIKSINVLKDAASAAIYGARGANGVVLITTVSGNTEAVGSISYNGYYGIQQPWRQLDLLTAREYAIMRNESRINAGKVPLVELQDPSLLGEGTDWQAAIFETAPQTNHQLRFQTGTATSNLAVSGSYLNQDGIVGGEKAGFERYTVRLAGNNQVKKYLDVGTNLNFTYLQRNFLPENNEFNTPLVRALNMDPITPVRKADGTYAYSIYSDTDITNPVNAIEQTSNRWASHRVVGNVYAELNPLPGLRIRSAYSVDATFAFQRIFNPIFNLSNDPVLNDAPGGERTVANSVAEQRLTWRNWQWENTATYQHVFNKRHDFTATLGTSLLSNRYDFLGGGNSDLPSNNPDDAFLGNTIAPIESQTAGSFLTESALASYFGRVNYVFDGRFLFSTTLRVDGSSRFGANNRYGYFPSVSGGYLISEEDFFDVDPVSSLKVRASWGRNGNDRIGDYGFSTVVSAGQNYTFGEGETITNGAVPLTPANPDLRWETTTQTDIGLDLELLNGQVYFVTDYYRKMTTDMLFAAPIPLYVGSAPPVQNIGSVLNTGWEFALNWRPRTGDWKFDLGANISFVENEVVSLGMDAEPLFTGRVQSANSFVSRTAVGEPIAGFYGFVTDGLFQTQAEVEAHAFQNEQTQPGDIRFKDLNNDGVIDLLDQDYIGNPTPDFVYGFTGDVSWKSFDFNVFLQGTQGNDIYNATVRYDFSYVNRPAAVLDRWTGPGTSNSVPRLSDNDANQNARVSDRFVEDGSYLRVKNVVLGYSLPKPVIEKLRVQRLRFYLSAQNLLTFTDYSGLDPEIGTFFNSPLEIGIDKGFYPQARTFLGGVNLTF